MAGADTAEGFTIGDHVAPCSTFRRDECRWGQAGVASPCGAVPLLGISWHCDGVPERLDVCMCRAYHLGDTASQGGRSIRGGWSALVGLGRGENAVSV